MEYLKYFENKTSAEGYKTESYFVGYLGEENTVLYSVGGEVIKDGEMVMEEPDPTAGFVDLGLSVMWASCNLGASSPEEPGLFYSWGEVEGHELAEDGVSFKDGHGFNSNNYQNPNIDTNCTLLLSNDAVYLSMLEHPSHDIVKFRMPTFDLYNELIANTTSELSVINNRSVYVLTSVINGNSITIPIVGGFFTTAEGVTSHYNSYSYLWGTSNNAGAYTSNLSDADVYDYVDHQFLPHACDVHCGLPIRGVCDNWPQADILFPGKKLNIIKDNVYAVRCEHGLEIPFTGTIQLSATPDFTTFTSIQSVDLLQLTPFDLTHYVNNILYTPVNASWPISFDPATYCYVRFDTNIHDTLNYYNIEYLNTPLFYNTMKVRTKCSSTTYGRFPMLRIKYDSIKNTSITIQNTSNGNARICISNSPTSEFSSSAPSVLYYKSLSRKSSITIDNNTVESFKPHVDENGYLYLGYSALSSTTVTLLFNVETTELN